MSGHLHCIAFREHYQLLYSLLHSAKVDQLYFVGGNMPSSTGGKEIGYCAVPDPKRRQENNGEFINHIIVSSLLRIKLNVNEGYAD